MRQSKPGRLGKVARFVFLPPFRTPPVPNRLLLDAPGGRRYIAAMFQHRLNLRIVVAVFASVLVDPALAETVSGAQLPDGVQKVGEFRYRSPQNWEETLKYYRTVYPPGTHPRRWVVNQPGVKALHIANPSKRGFEGLNVYEANDEVRIFVLAAEPPPKPAKRSGKGKKK
ncbi:MAG: hypothetical protein ACKVPX_08950 [Myxococcaceae bacterium]